MDSLIRRKVLFLFRELAGYFVTCVEELASTGNFDVEVVYWPVNVQAHCYCQFGLPISWNPSSMIISLHCPLHPLTPEQHLQ